MGPMTPRYTVWEWNQYNGWKLFFGTSAWGAADQVRRGLTAYQPQNYYGVYGTYNMAADYEIYGYGGQVRYSWGYAPSGDNVWIIQYSLTKILRPDFIVGARAMSAAAHPGGGQPTWVMNELNQHDDYAHRTYGTVCTWCRQYA